jgi:hypothetical protein
MVLPDPGPPISSVVRPRGKPPPLISSKPTIPVGAFLETAGAGERSDFIMFPFPRNAHRTEDCSAGEISDGSRTSAAYVLCAAAVCAVTHIDPEADDNLEFPRHCFRALPH